MEKQIIFEGDLTQFCVGCSSYNNCVQTKFDLICCNYEEENYKETEIPTTWEEFKDFCKDIKDCEVKDDSVIFHFKRKNRHDFKLAEFKLAEFKQEGDLYIAEKIIGSADCVKIGSNLSVKQMYQFLILFKNIRDKEYDIDKK